jgi:hypothetical protein
MRGGAGRYSPRAEGAGSDKSGDEVVHAGPAVARSKGRKLKLARRSGLLWHGSTQLKGSMWGRRGQCGSTWGRGGQCGEEDARSGVRQEREI